MRRTIALLAVLVLLAPATASAAGSSERAVLKGINAERASHGLKPLRLATPLRRVAGRHSRFMARIERLQHESADGTSATTRIRRAMKVRRAGETIAFAADAAAIVQAWMESKPHRDILLSKQFRLIGIGVVAGTYEGYGVLYATADLGA
jgi:uncharacterized protein YkwD